MRNSRSFKVNHGWKYQDLRAVDRSETTILAALPQYSWRTKVATTNRAYTQGELFSIPGGGLIDPPAGGLMRGGLFPSVVASVSGPSPDSKVVGQNLASKNADVNMNFIQQGQKII
jgi:hypothetical protein